MLTKEEVAKLPRAERLERLGRTAHELDQAIADRPETVLCRRPDEKNWAPKEVVCHLRDAEEFFMLRFQILAAAHEPPLVPADPERWAEDRQYIRNDAAEAGRAFRRRREESLAHLRGLSDPQWTRAGLHPTYGRMTVEDVMNLMVWHDANHLDQLHRAIRGEA
jgi:DinB superfamily